MRWFWVAFAGAGFGRGALDASERERFEAHAAACDLCRAEIQSIASVVGNLGLAVPQVDPPEALRGRVLTVAGVSAAPAGRRAGGAGWAWLAAAAALVLCAGLAGYALLLRSRVEDLHGRLAEAERGLAATQSEVVDARRALGDATSSVRVLLAPDLSRVDLDGQASAPTARGRAFFSPSTGLVFAASNLPPLPADRSYQLWMVTATAPVSAGLLVPEPDGTTRSTRPSPTSESPVAFAVTIEPAGGVPAPTGDKVLIGLVDAPD